MTAHIRTLGAGRLVCAAALSLSLALGLSACGKKGAPKPPEGQESQYTYPQPYPHPSTVTPDEEADPTDGANPLSIFTGSDRRTKTKTY